MVLWGDVDNDGDQDLFVTYRLAANKLLLSNGEGSLQDVSATCGINQASRKSYGASFGDYNADGFLDLFVCNYTSSFDEYPFNELYENNGDGTFTETTVPQGLDALGVQSFQGQWVDFDGRRHARFACHSRPHIYELLVEQQPAGAISRSSRKGETGRP